jgi:hypothetical protein
MERSVGAGFFATRPLAVIQDAINQIIFTLVECGAVTLCSRDRLEA